MATATALALSPPTTTASSEAPAAPHTDVTPAAAAGKGMGDIVDLRVQGDMGPATTFEQDPQSQYPPTGYPYPRNHEPYALEGDLQMVDAMSHEMQNPNTASQMQVSNPHINIPQPASNGPGMAPPQTPHQQSFPSPTGGQPGMENLPDAGSMSEDHKRKRSKVSRACDECRRKKIRCDATDDDGSVKTCSNCSRVQQTCSFSRVPMKRGPSKGYIKELSERVQQVESQIAISGQPGFRQSIDGASVYPESAYSPDEPMSGKRGYSFSDPKNPFAQAHFTERDKMPSIGGWNSFSSAGAAGPGPRDSRGSIQVAPDQQSPDVSTTRNGQHIEHVPPFWAREDDEIQAGRASKRQKTGSEDTVDLLAGLSPESLTTYADTIHPVLPILPFNVDQIVTALRVCPSELQHAFLDVLGVVQHKGRRENSVFASYPAVEDYIWSESSKRLGLGQNRQNVVWTWIYLLMAIHAENDSQRPNNNLPTSTLTRLALDVASDTFIHAKAQSSTTNAVEEPTIEHTRRSFTCAVILSRLHSLGTNGFDHVPRQLEDDVGSFQHHKPLPDITLLLARLSNTVSLLIDLIYQTTVEGRPSSSTVSHRRSIDKQIAFILGSTPQNVALQTLGSQFRLFAAIILARTTYITDPAHVLHPALALTESLFHATTTSTDDSVLYNPLAIHFFALTVITLLEFSHVIDGVLAEKARTALPRLQQALEIIAKRHQHAADDEAVHWSAALAHKLEAQTGNAEKEVNGTLGSTSVQTIQQARDHSGHDGQGDKFIDDKTGHVQLVDFRRLFRTGYLVLLQRLCQS